MSGPRKEAELLLPPCRLALEVGPGERRVQVVLVGAEQLELRARHLVHVLGQQARQRAYAALLRREVARDGLAQRRA